MAIDINTGVFKEIHGLKLFEYLPFYGMLLYGVFRNGLVLKKDTYPTPKGISVVIPTLNETGQGCQTSFHAISLVQSRNQDRNTTWRGIGILF